MEIGVIGIGGQGETLARHLARLGHEVSISNSRGRLGGRGGQELCISDRFDSDQSGR
jgi:prephenate dehydrogenase